MQRCSVVDLFCGIGGLTHGFYDEGFNIVAGIDSDPSCRYAYEVNNPGARFIHEDITSLEGRTVDLLFPQDDIRILVGCAPCQPFSSYTNKLQRKNQRQWSLLSSFGRIIEEIHPEIVSMENVPSLGTKSIFKEFLGTLHSNGYYVKWSNVYCPDYGVPQRRTRLVLYASKFGNIDIIEPTFSKGEYNTVRSVIGDLPPIEAGETSSVDHLHRASVMSEMNMKRIRSSKPGGTWKDWDSSLITECHKKSTGKSYYNVYGRMNWDDLAPTITTQFIGFGNGRFGHPEQDRALSLREGALLQTFPADYEFIDPDSPYYISRIAKHIGNAVPVKLGSVIAMSIEKHINELFFA